LSSSESSDNWTMGSPSIISLSKGWGRESRSLKNGDTIASNDLWTRKLTLSDDRIMTFASGTSRGIGGDMVEQISA
jgi:hypothetical protein